MLYYHTHHTNVNIKEGKAINWFCRWKKKCLVYNILKLLIYTHRLYNIIYYPIFFLDESCCRTLYIHKVDFYFFHFPINLTRASLQIEKSLMLLGGVFLCCWESLSSRDILESLWGQWYFYVGWFQHSLSTLQHVILFVKYLFVYYNYYNSAIK